MYDRILVALDGRGLAERALPVVISLARRSLAEVIVLAVDEGAADIERTTAAVAAHLERHGVRAWAQVRQPDDDAVAATIARAARLAKADLVVLGSQGHGDLAGLLLGSVSHAVASQLDCAALIVHDGTDRPVEDERPIRRILAAVDGSDGSAAAMDAAARLAREHGARILVAHAPERRRRGDLSPAVLLAAACRRLHEAGVAAEERILPGDEPVAARLAEAAELWDADLSVLGSRRLTNLGGLLLGSVAHQLVRRSSRPVLLAAPNRRE